MQTHHISFNDRFQSNWIWRQNVQTTLFDNINNNKKMNLVHTHVGMGGEEKNDPNYYRRQNNLQKMLMFLIYDLALHRLFNIH